MELNGHRVVASLDHDPRDVEDAFVALVRDVVAAVRIPVAVKLGPAWTALGHLAARLVEAGADGLVLFNRFYQPDIDVDTRAVTPHLELSTPHEQLLPLRWTAILHGRLDTCLGVTTGVHDAIGVAKALPGPTSR